MKPVVDRRHNDASEREDVLVAIKEAFDTASRQIEDIARDMRGQVKEHTAESHGRVAKLLSRFRLANQRIGFLWFAACADSQGVWHGRKVSGYGER